MMRSPTSSQDLAASGEPIQVWQYGRGRFVDVTRRYPGLITKDAALWWRAYEQNKGASSPDGGDVRGVLAAWAADEAMLGHAAAAKQTLLDIAYAGTLNQGASLSTWPTGLAYVQALWRFLAKNRYLG